MDTSGVFCEADMFKACKMAAGVWGCYKGKEKAPKFFDFFCLDHTKILILNKVKIQ